MKPTGKPTILIVDDQISTRQNLHNLLQADFKIVGEASDGREALQVCDLQKPEIVLMDVIMPHQSGIEALRNILKSVNPPPIVVMLSGVKEEKVVMEAFEAGASDYLFKPIDSDQVLKVLNDQMSKKKRSSP